MSKKIAPPHFDNQAEPKIQLGKYEHYKGKMYEVVGLVIHSETEELMVLYKALYELDAEKKKLDPPVLFARPYNMFFDSIAIDGKEVPRFKFVGKSNSVRVA